MADTTHKGYVGTTGGQIHYLECGQGPAIVLLHATSDSAVMWEELLPRLAHRNAGFVAMPWVGPDAVDEEPDLFCRVVVDFLRASG
ncbi:MAG: hypothetical protein FJX65_04680 [Alphaproteobacteria bacterium]|nr:hypothetical protein [Alphaproteobacteria bacterium]